MPAKAADYHEDLEGLRGERPWLMLHNFDEAWQARFPSLML